MSKTRNRKVLDGYKKEKKNYVPPLKQLPKTNNYTSYVDDILPELFWIALLNHSEGYDKSARIQEKLFKFTDGLTCEHPPKMTNFAFCSSYKYLSKTDTEAIKVYLKKEKLLDHLQASLAPLIKLYPSFPLRFIGLGNNENKNSDLTKTINDVMSNVIDKYATPGVVLNASPTLFLIFNERTSYPKGHFERDPYKIITEPNSEETQKCGNFFRASALGFFCLQEFDDNWRRDFWDRNMMLTQCDFSHIGDSYV